MFKRSLINTSRGFTLVELLITITLSLVLAGGALAAYNRFNVQQIHVQQARNVIANIEQARTRASVGDQPSTCTTLDGYRVRGSANSGQYFTEVRCGGAAVETEQYSLPTGYTFAQNFDALFRSYPYDVASVDQTVGIRRSGSTMEYRFVILKRGPIEDQGFVTP